MLRELWNKRNLRIDELYIRGGGNEVGDCRKMSLQWIRGLVEEIVTNGQWDVDQFNWAQTLPEN